MLTVSEAARVLGLAVSTLRRHVLLGDLRGRKFGHLWMLRRSDVDAFARTPRPTGVHRTPRTPKASREAPEPGEPVTTRAEGS